jgi:uncharacterized protein related to proFAR isomerase
MEEIRCVGCGALLQDLDEKKPGYVSSDILYRPSLERVVCKRCHQIKNYNLITKNEMSTEQYYKILKKIAAKDALFVYVVDVFDLNSTLNEEVINLIKDKEVLLIHCKNSIYPLKQDIIRKFIGDCHMYEKENNKYLNNKIIKRMIVSNSNMDKGCELYFKQHKVECNFLQIKEN